MTKTFQKYKSLLGISFDDKRMTASVLRLTGERLTLDKTLNTALTLDLLNSDPELTGRELKRHVEEAGIREKRCVVSIPARWMLTFQTELPAGLSEEDRDSFIRIQSEREFPFSPDDLCMSVSFFQTSQAQKQAMVVAMPLSHLVALQRVLKAAGLHPLSITLGITSLFDRRMPSGFAVLLLNKNCVDIMIVAGGGIAALRSLPEAVEVSPDGKLYDTEIIVRELRITLGQLSGALKDSIRTLYIFGAAEGILSVSDELNDALSGMEISVDQMPLAEKLHLANPEAVGKMTPISYAMAARFLSGAGVEFEFLPPRSSLRKKIVNRLSARYTFWLTSAAIAFVALLGAAFLLQYWYLSRLEKQWERIAPGADRIQSLQENIRMYRPWYDDSIQSLSIIKKITLAFPEGDAVWVKTLEIKELSKVSCSGEARTSRDWLLMLERLRKTAGINDLQVLQVRGNAPLLFTFTFRWRGEDADGI
jgi:hypothetical protein